MKKKWKVTIAIMIGILGLFFLTPLRYYNPPLKGAGGLSKSIDESNCRGVLLFYYEIKNNPIKLKNNLVLHVKEAWAEKAWIYPLFSNQTEIPNDPTLYNICVSFYNDTETLSSYFRSAQGGNLSIGVYPKVLGGTDIFALGSHLLLSLPADMERFPIVVDDPVHLLAPPIDTLGFLELKAVK